MSFFYSQTNNYKIGLMILALKTTLNNIDLFSSIEDRILISSTAPLIIQKLSLKKDLERKDIYTLSIALAFVHNVFTSHTNIKIDDLERIQPHKLTYEELYEQYKFFGDVE